MARKQKKLFCEMNPLFYKISLQKEICRRHLRDLRSKEKFAATFREEKLPNLVSSYDCGLIKRGPGIELRLQENKATNIALAGSRINGIVIHPGEMFSFWRTVGRTTKSRGYKEGRIIKGNRIIPGIGGGLCNLGNTIHLLVLHSPLTVTEFHKHSDALAPDNGKRVPFSAGTSVSYNYVDYRFRNDTDQDVQLVVWCRDERLFAELRSERPFPWSYALVEEDHHFRREGEKYYRISKIYQQVTDRTTGGVVGKNLVLDNHSEVMYDYSLIPADQIREPQTV